MIFLNLFMRLTPGKRHAKSIVREAIQEMAHYISSSSNASTTDTFELLADILVSFRGLPGGLVHEKDMLLISDLWRQLPKQNKNKEVLFGACHVL